MTDSQQTPRKLPRGIRNNNPLNLRISNNPWRGKVYDGQDPAFEEFTSMVYGIRAAMINIRTIINRRIRAVGKCTLQDIINVWAPPSDGNNTRSYVQQVANAVGIATNVNIYFHPDIIIPIVVAMCNVENGLNPETHAPYITTEQCKKAYNLI